MSNRRAFVGDGALAAQLRHFLAPSGAPEVVFDDARLQGGALPLERLDDAAFADCDFYLALGYRHLGKKSELAKRLLALGRRLPPFVHERAFVDPGATVGAGAVVYPGCNVGAGVRLGAAALLNDSCSVSHDSAIGDAAFLAPGVTVCGAAEIGASTFVGAGSVVVNHVRLGRGCIVGAGTVVARDLPDGASAVGNPMRVLSRPLRLR